jgi:2-aminoadipate transaminase
MDYPFSNRIKNMKPSAIREILKSASDPEVISLSAGNPAPEAFPVKEIAEITEKIMRERPIDALQYSITEGYTPLRKCVADYMKKNHGVGREFDRILITSGAQQVMDMAAKALCNEGDAVVCEAPSFIGSLNAFRSYNAHLIGVPMESDGMNTEALESVLKSNKNIKFIYTIPNFQNPSGVTMSLKKRKEVYRLADKYNCLILEDNPYGDIRFAGEDIPPIKSLDDKGIVIYAGSFSKVLAPGIRVGYCIAPEALCAKMTICKQTSDVHTTILPQMIAYEFMTNYDFEGHLKRIRKIYKNKAELLMNLADKYLSPKVTFDRIEGGLFLWCRLPDGVDMQDFCKKAIEHKVALVPGNAFLTSEDEPCSYFRINYSTPSDDELRRGMEILGTLVKEL